jgi:hypothetical protein
MAAGLELAGSMENCSEGRRSNPTGAIWFRVLTMYFMG